MKYHYTNNHFNIYTNIYTNNHFNIYTNNYYYFYIYNNINFTV